MEKAENEKKEQEALKIKALLNMENKQILQESLKKREYKIRLNNISRFNKT